MIAGLLFAAVVAGDIGYAQAKALADAQEKALSSEQSAQLIGSQGRAVGQAMPACVHSPAQRPGAFVVVMRLDAAGKVQQTWLHGETDVTRCINGVFAAATLFVPPSAPFYTSFEYTPGH